MPRGITGGVLAALALSWLPSVLSPGSGLTAPVVQSVIVLGLGALTVVSRRAKVAVVRVAQRHLVNPVVRGLFAVGLNPLGLVVLETRGRRSGRPRRTPVGNGRDGDVLWVIAEHGLRAHYVRNIQADPRVRVRIRVGLRYRWLDAVATVLTEDDALARQRQIVRWHPLRALNAVSVRVLGTDLLTVRLDLLPVARSGADRAGQTVTPDEAGLAPAPAVGAGRA